VKTLDLQPCYWRASDVSRCPGEFERVAAELDCGAIASPFAIEGQRVIQPLKGHARKWDFENRAPPLLSIAQQRRAI
jgi:hypothetical protein